MKSSRPYRSAYKACMHCSGPTRSTRTRFYASHAPHPPDTPPEPGPSKPRFDSAEALQTFRMRTATARIALAERSIRLRRDLEHRLVEMSASFSKFTGYGQIELLKEQVARAEQALLDARSEAKLAKETFETATDSRKTSQRESNDLLQRKSTWNEADVSRFTELVKRDHVCETEERDAKRILVDCEEVVERAFSTMMSAILARYHEEQVWSDKIRSLSTYGSFALTSANVLIFLLALFLVEPWRRNRLIEGVEERLHEREAESAARSQEGLLSIVERLSQAEAKLDRALADLGSSAPPGRVPAPLSSSSLPSASVPDLGSVLNELLGDGDIEVEEETPSDAVESRWRDVAIAGLGGAALGALTIAFTSWR